MSGLLEDDWRVPVGEETAEASHMVSDHRSTAAAAGSRRFRGVTLPPPPGAALTPFDFSQNDALSDFYEAQSGTVLGS